MLSHKLYEARAMGEQKTLSKVPYQVKAYTEDTQDYIYKHDSTLKGEN
jgi:hypothetical protein